MNLLSVLVNPSHRTKIVLCLELSATTITFNPCEPQSQDQDSPVPELSVSTTANRLVIYPCHRTK